MGPTDTGPPPFWLGLTRARAAGMDLEQALHDGLIPPQAYAAILAACAQCTDPQACDADRRDGRAGLAAQSCANAELITQLRAL